jgi:hypothetical protein
VDLIHAEHEERLAEAIKVLDEVLVLKTTALLLRDACDRELRDPQDATRYHVGPRAWDVDIIYEETEVMEEDGDGTPTKTRRVRKRAPLSELLERVPNTLQVKITQPHPVDMILKTVDRWMNSLELVARLTGELKAGQNNVQVNVALMESPEWVTFKQVLTAALAPFPEARAAVAAAMMRQEKALEGGNSVPTVR